MQGQNTLSLSSTSGHPGDTATVTLSLANSDAVTALQTFIPLDGNLAYVPGSAALTDRANGHQLSATVQDGSLQIYSYSLTLAPYAGNSGALLTFRVVLGREPGSITMTPTQTLLSSDSGTALPVSSNSGSITVLAPKVRVTPAAMDYGHVPIRGSYTRTVTVKNIGNEPMTLTDVTFSDSTLSLNANQLTLNANTQQSITLTYSPTAAGATTMTAVFHTDAKVGDSVVTIAADPYAVNELRPLNVSGYTDSVVTVELRMNNMDSIVGLQTSIKLPSALTYVEGSFVADSLRAFGHLATAGLQGDTLTLLLTSLTGTPIHGADGVVARFQLRLHGYGSYTLRLLQTALGDGDGHNVLSAVYSGSVNIYSPYLSCNSSISLGSTPVTELATASLSIYNSGNAMLVIDHVVFTQDGWQLQDSMPVTVESYRRDTLRVVYTGAAEGNHSAQMLLYTNDPRNDLKRIDLTAHRFEPNKLYLQGNAEAPASAPEVDIMLDNYSAVTALQLDVRYPHSHFTLEPSDISLAARADNHIVSASRLDDSTLRVLVLSMQNQPFAGNSGAVARMRLHAFDSLDMQSYPITIGNITSGCTDGVDRLSSIQTTGWFATRVVYDTVVITDTAFVDVPYTVHDTIAIHDTVTLTVYTDVPIHDTTYITQIDTVTNTVYDTVTLTVYVDLPVHDTTWIHDTTWVDNYITIYDTTWVDNYITIYDTIVRTDTIRLPSDTVFITIYDTIYDTVYISDQGIVETATSTVKVYASHGNIVVEGSMGNLVYLYDAVGRLLAMRRSEEVHDGTPLRFETPATGTYMVKVGNHPASRVVVIR